MQELREEDQHRLALNLAEVRGRMEDAADRAGRKASDVRLVAVTKTVSAEISRALVDLGVESLGENRPEQIVAKAAEFEESLPWRMIGHFQSKKIAKCLPYIEAVDSVHNLELLSRLDQKARDLELSAPLRVLIQVNIAGEGTKQGFSPEDAPHAAELAAAFTHLKADGFMTMAPADADERERRSIFAALRELRDAAGADRFPELSMGMSNDFEEAIIEGATMVRIGSALFDDIPRSR